MPSRFEYERAVRSSDLPSLSRLLALTVATWADVKTGVIPDRLQPSLTTLEEATGMARGSVRKHLDTLEEGGWLKRDRPSVAAARSAKARTKYTVKVPRGAVVSDTDGIELGQDVPSARAGDALDEPGLGQETPQARAGDALALGQEMTTTRAGAALSSSYGPKTSVEYQLHRPPAVATPAPEDTDAFRVAQPLVDEMTRRGMRLSWQMQAGDWKDLIGLIHAHGAPALADHAERVWRSSKNPPYSARYFLAGWRGLAALPPEALPSLRAVPAMQSTADQRVAAGLALAEKFREEERRALDAGPDANQEPA